MLAAAPGGAARAADYVADASVMLFEPGSAAISEPARDALLAFLRPPRPPGFRGHCLRGHADPGPGADALSLARLHAVAAMMARQGIDPADIALEARGGRAPARIAAAGTPEPMNDRVELIPCPGPRLADVPEAAERALDAAVVPGFVAALAPLVARAIGCADPEPARGALAAPPFDCPAGMDVADVPALSVLRVAGTRRVAVTLDWPAGLPAAAARWRMAAAAGAVLDLFGHVPAAPVLRALMAEEPAARRSDFAGPLVRAEVEAGPGPLRRLRVVTLGAAGE